MVNDGLNHAVTQQQLDSAREELHNDNSGLHRLLHTEMHIVEGKLQHISSRLDEMQTPKWGLIIGAGTMVAMLIGASMTVIYSSAIRLENAFDHVSTDVLKVDGRLNTHISAATEMLGSYRRETTRHEKVHDYIMEHIRSGRTDNDHSGHSSEDLDYNFWKQNTPASPAGDIRQMGEKQRHESGRLDSGGLGKDTGFNRYEE